MNTVTQKVWALCQAAPVLCSVSRRMKGFIWCFGPGPCLGVSERREGVLAWNQKSGTVFSIQTGKDERVFKLEGIVLFMLTKLIYKNSSGYCIERAYCVPGTPLGPLQFFS